MFDSIKARLDEVLQTRRAAEAAVRDMQTWLASLSQFDLSEVCLIDSTDATGWHCRPTATAAATIDLGACNEQLQLVKRCCQNWTEALARLRADFRSVPPEDIDDLFHAIPELRTDRSLLDLSHSGL